MHCDLVAIKHDSTGEEEILIVEMKKTFNLALLLQGVERLRLGGHVVLAVERNRKKSGAHNQRFGDLTELCRLLGIGLMTITFFKTKAPLVEMLCELGKPPAEPCAGAGKPACSPNFTNGPGITIREGSQDAS